MAWRLPRDAAHTTRAGRSARAVSRWSASRCTVARSAARAAAIRASAPSVGGGVVPCATSHSTSSGQPARAATSVGVRPSEVRIHDGRPPGVPNGVRMSAPWSTRSRTRSRMSCTMAHHSWVRTSS